MGSLCAASCAQGPPRPACFSAPGASVSVLGGYIICATLAARCLTRWPPATVSHWLRILSLSLPFPFLPVKKDETDPFLSLPALRLPRADVDRALIITSLGSPYISTYTILRHLLSFFSAHIVHFTTAFFSAH
jgi:hypothetical protein